MRVEEVSAQYPLANANGALAVHQLDQPGLSWRERQGIVGRVPAPRGRWDRLVGELVEAHPRRDLGGWFEWTRLQEDHATLYEDPFDLGWTPSLRKLDQVLPQHDFRLGRQLPAEAQVVLGKNLVELAKA